MFPYRWRDERAEGASDAYGLRGPAVAIRVAPGESSGGRRHVAKRDTRNPQMLKLIETVKPKAKKPVAGPVIN